MKEEREEEEVKRSSWGNHLQFFLSSLGLAVGLGNIWRFPYICYDNGGATFLIPYFLMLFLVGLPMFFLELGLGQWAGVGATKIYTRVSPALRGMGYGMITIPTLINFYYVVIMAWALHYLFSGLTSSLPWSRCNQRFNSDHCYSLVEAETCLTDQVFYIGECISSDEFCHEMNCTYDPAYTDSCINTTSRDTIKMSELFYRVSPSEEYWYYRVLGMNVVNGSLVVEDNSWVNWGEMQWEILGCLALSWILICVFLSNGIQSYGKVVYFTTLFPYLVLTILLGYTATLEGFGNGLEYYFIPRDWNDLLDIQVWNAAAGQIFYSLGVALGTHLMLASYNNFTENVQRDAILIAFCNSFTSIYAGLVVFGCLGYLSLKKGVSIEDVIQSGPGLAFIVYPEAISLMDIPPLFSFLFFFMLVLLAISSICATWEGMIGTLMDEFPTLRKHRLPVMIVSCIIGFLCGISMCFNSGFLMFDLIDGRASNAILLLAFIELITISWFYGVDKFISHVKDMGIYMPWPLKIYWYICWIAISPALLLLVIFLFWAEGQQDQFLDYIYEAWVQALGWGLEFVAIAIVASGTVYEVASRVRNGESVAPFNIGPLLSKRSKTGHSWAPLVPGKIMSPTIKWGPRPDRPTDVGPCES